jgi:hypothetical protein
MSILVPDIAITEKVVRPVGVNLFLRKASRRCARSATPSSKRMGS